MTPTPKNAGRLSLLIVTNAAAGHHKLAATHPAEKWFRLSFRVADNPPRTGLAILRDEASVWRRGATTQSVG
jgi:hypothetical protein